MSDPSADDRNDYLWDRSAPADPDVQALEQLLGRFAHDDRPPAVHTVPPGASTTRAWHRLALLAAILVAGVGAWMWQTARGDTGHEYFGEGIRLVLAEGEITDDDGGFAAVTQSRLELTDVDDNWIGDFTLAAGSRAAVDTLGRNLTRLALSRGRLEAFVAADARPRFFQVDTPSARCIDLGCRYTLDVDDNGDAHVVVTLGQVAFENLDRRERYVPQGAECRATRELGLGTPRFPGVTPGLDAQLDAFDACTKVQHEARRRLARTVCEAAAVDTDTLAVWHLLDDPDETIVAIAEQALLRIAGAPPAARAQKALTFSREEWREHLEALWY